MLFSENSDMQLDVKCSLVNKSFEYLVKKIEHYHFHKFSFSNIIL